MAGVSHNFYDYDVVSFWINRTFLRNGLPYRPEYDSLYWLLHEFLSISPIQKPCFYTKRQPSLIRPTK